MSQAQSIYGLVGFPVKHSLSPAMHNTAFQALGVDASYQLFPLKENELEPFFRNLRKKDSPIFGLNVTVPYKEAVIPFMDSLSPFAEKLKAVNTVVVGKDRQLSGHNTDGPGFLAHLAELKCSFAGKRVAIMGAGGASRALVGSLCLVPAGPHAIRIYDVDYDRADRLVRDLGERLDVSPVEIVRSIDELNIELADLLINATPVGLRENDICLVDESLIHPHVFVYDLIYNPAETKLLKLARSQGAGTANGLGMLFYQGVLAFQHWADMELPEEIKHKMRQALKV